MKPTKIDKEKPAIVIAQMSIMSTGISIKNLHNVVLLSSTKAFTTIIQIIGRLLRLHNSKTKAHLYDIIDDISKIGSRGGVKENFVLKHFYQRLEYYRSEEYNINEKEIFL